MSITDPNNITYKVARRIKHLSSNIILRSDLADLGSYRQISRTLHQLVREEKLARISQGVYAKMRPSSIDGQPVLDGAFSMLAREALDRLGVFWEPETAEKEYNAGLSTQVPVHGRVRLMSRCRRKITWGGMTLLYESDMR